MWQVTIWAYFVVIAVALGVWCKVITLHWGWLRLRCLRFIGASIIFQTAIVYFPSG